MAQQALQNFFPDDVNGYVPKGTIRYYTPENLFDYINGGAELFISYGFDTVASLAYVEENKPQLLAEIFRMNSAADAYGVYSIQREKENVTIGQGGQYIPGSLMFWKDNYFVSLIAERETAESKEILLNFGKKVSENIPKEGNPPALVELIPEQNLVDAGIKYFHHPVWQNTYYFIAHENIFLINDDTPSLLARYGKAGNRYFLLLVEYGSPGKANDAYISAKEAFFNGMDEEGFLQLEDEKWALLDQGENYLIAIFNADQKDKIVDLHESMLKNIQSR